MTEPEALNTESSPEVSDVVIPIPWQVKFKDAIETSIIENKTVILNDSTVPNKESCSICHDPACTFILNANEPPKSPVVSDQKSYIDSIINLVNPSKDIGVEIKKRVPRTQKGKSIYYGCNSLGNICANHALRGYSYGANNKVSVLGLIQSEDDIKNLGPIVWKSKVFARPCPKTPRHGFVDSRIVSNVKQLTDLLEETLGADPEGEIILTEFINKARYNAVLSTSGLLSIGPGHDGATAGKKSISLAVKPENLGTSHPDIVLDSGLTKKDNVFIEAVFTRMQKATNYYNSPDLGLKITQVRGGPPVKSVNDFVPKKIKVKKVIYPSNDLLAWESQVKKLEPGTVVYGKGHSLASHAAIHCVINKIPFITSFVPQVGQEIRPSLERSNRLNHRQFRVGVTVGLTDSRDIRHMFHISIMVLHNWAYLRNSPHASWLLGLSAAYLTKVMCALNYGEYRHFANKHYVKRASIYKKVIRSNRFGVYMHRAPKVAKVFIDKGKYKHAYGGPPWAKSVKSSMNIWNAVANIHEYGLTTTRVNRLLTLINKSVNLIHNNGWLFNKITDHACMEVIASYPGLAALQMSDIIYDLYKKSGKVKRLRNVSFVKKAA